MDAIEYFISRSTFFVVVIGVVFFLVGMFFGTLLSSGLRSRLKESQNKIADFETSSAHLKNQLAELQDQLAHAASEDNNQPESTPPAESTASEPGPAEIPEPQPPPAPAVTPASFGALIADGTMIADEKFGAIYAGAPTESDDLTRIKGVGKVLNGKLNNFGVFTFKQIALWDETNVAEFSERFSFKDRIKRDDWPGQAHRLHHEKYHEEL